MGDEQEARKEYDKAKDELIKALVKKRGVDKQLAQLEVQIHNLEGAYLNETSGHGGNIILGFENYLKTTGPSKKKYEVTDNDRMFSNSSATYMKSIEMLNESDSDNEQKLNTNSGLVTVSLTPAPRSQEPSTAQLKRERDREYQRKKRASNRQRSVASTEENESVIPKRTTKRQRMQDEGTAVEL